MLSRLKPFADRRGQYGAYTEATASISGGGGILIYNPPNSGVHALIKHINHDSANTGAFAKCYTGLTSTDYRNTQLTPVAIQGANDAQCEAWNLDAESVDGEMAVMTKRLTIFPEYPRRPIPGIIVVPGFSFFLWDWDYNLSYKCSIFWQEVRR